MGYQVLGVTIGLLVLYAAFRLIEATWPESYMALSDYASYRKLSRPLQYALFRFGPVFAVSLFLSVSLDRGGQAVWPAVVALGALHGGATSGRAVKQLWPRASDPRRSPLVVLHVGVILAVIVTAIVAAAVRSRLQGLIPDLDQVAVELWTASIAAVLGAYFVLATRTRRLDIGQLVEMERRHLGSELLEYARQVAHAEQADPELVEAIMLTEGLQRPHWFRRLERMKSVVFKDGTYGIMQVTNHGSLSDRESIERAVTKHLAGKRVPERVQSHKGEERRYLDTEALKSQLAGYNASPTWVAMVVEILQYIRRKR
jgi:hypothetical protein